MNYVGICDIFSTMNLWPITSQFHPAPPMMHSLEVFLQRFSPIILKDNKHQAPYWSSFHPFWNQPCLWILPTNPDNEIKLWYCNGFGGYKNRIIWGVFRKSPSNDPQLPGPVDQGHDVFPLNIQLLPELSFLFLHLENPGFWLATLETAYRFRESIAISWSAGNNRTLGSKSQSFVNCNKKEGACTLFNLTFSSEFCI